MEASKKISIISMHDDGKTRRWRISLFFYRVLWVLCILLPLITVAAVWQAALLWQENTALTTNTARLELAMHEAKSIADRLSNLESLLAQEELARGPVLQNLARQSAKEAPATPQPTGDEVDTTESGPGHGDFPTVDTKVVSVENVTARLVRAGKIRINLDLRNPDPKRTVAGYVRCSFISDSGETLPMALAAEQADFKITRFKRAVFQPTVPPTITDTTNARIIIEVYLEDEKTLVYRNIYPLGH